MRIREVHKFAKTGNVDVRVYRSKMDMIRDIEVAEGYSPCFRAKDVCIEDCLWKEDCVNLR